MKQLSVAVIIAGALSFVAVPHHASAAPPPYCNAQTGPPTIAPCQETDHFDTTSFLGSPLPAFCVPPNDPAAVDYALVKAVGNGVFHVTVNKAGDAWFTGTFTGAASVTLYRPDQVDTTDPNNPVLIDGAVADSDAPTYTGHLTQWFGGSFNRQSAVNHDTASLILVGSNGETIRFHMQGHAVWLPGSDPNGPPSMSSGHVTC